MLMIGPRSLILPLQLQMVMFFFPSCPALIHHAAHSEKFFKKSYVPLGLYTGRHF